MGETYILRNNKRYDINLGDLHYKVPAGKTRDLYSPTARLDRELIQLSKQSGSIAARLANGSLSEVVKHINLKRPPMEEAKTPFPRQNKSSVTLDSDKLDEEIQEMILSDDDELLKELDEISLMTEEAPIVRKKDDDGSET